jgi:hypothetical protein
LFAVAGCTSPGSDFFSSLWNDVIAPDAPGSLQVAEQTDVTPLALPVGLGIGLGDSEAIVAGYGDAAARGNAAAQHRLGYVYAMAEGVERDLVSAYAWLNLAAVNLPPGVEHDRAVANREIVAREMSPAEIAEAHRLIGEWAPGASPAVARTAGDITVEVEFQELGFLENLDHFSDRS